MGQITIELEYDPETGKKDIRIGYESDPDLTRAEHEADHRRIVESLLSKGVLQPDQVGEIIVTRGEESAEEAGRAPETPHTEAQKEST